MGNYIDVAPRAIFFQCSLVALYCSYDAYYKRNNDFVKEIQDENIFHDKVIEKFVEKSKTLSFLFK